MNKGIIKTIDFNEPQDINNLKLMLENGHYPAIFRFDVPSTDLLVEYGNHYARLANEDNKILWLLMPRESIEPDFVVLPGNRELTKVVSTETPPVTSKLNSDLTLIFKDQTRINLNDFQSKYQQEILNNEVERQR